MAETIAAVRRQLGGPQVSGERAACTRVWISLKATLWGLPLLHVTSGMDPQHANIRVSKGIIAIGGRRKELSPLRTCSGRNCLRRLRDGRVFRFGGCLLGGGRNGRPGRRGGSAGFGGTVMPLLAIAGCAVGYLAFGGQASACTCGMRRQKNRSHRKQFLPTVGKFP